MAYGLFEGEEDGSASGSWISVVLGGGAAQLPGSRMEDLV